MDYVLDVYTKLPTRYKTTWTFLVAFLSKVKEHADENLMTADNIGIVFSPAILWREHLLVTDVLVSKRESKIVANVVKYFVTNMNAICPELPKPEELNK